ncbi:hypothetical protein C8J57DRAFT_1349017, partial [Mycena rebaudengoi]
MGADVVVFSSTDSKHAEALNLGARAFYATAGVEKLNIGKQLDHLLVTTSFLPDWNLCVTFFLERIDTADIGHRYLGVMKPRGTIYPLTVSFNDLVFPNMPLITRGVTIQGSAVASRRIHRKMLEFAAVHKVQPIIEHFPLTRNGVEEGMARLRDGKMRYRGVLVAAT